MIGNLPAQNRLGMHALKCLPALLALFTVIALSDAEAQTDDCRQSTVNIGGNVSSVKLCKSKDGQYRSFQSSISQFSGRIIYSGEYNIIASQRPRNSRSRNLLGSILDTKTQTFQGFATLTVEFSGSQIKGKLVAPSLNPNVKSWPMTGSVSNGICTLYSQQGAKWSGQCDAAAFTGKQSYQDQSLNNNGTFDLRATEIVDQQELDRRTAEAAEKSQKEREAAALRDRTSQVATKSDAIYRARNINNTESVPKKYLSAKAENGAKPPSGAFEKSDMIMKTVRPCIKENWQEGNSRQHTIIIGQDGQGGTQTANVSSGSPGWRYWTFTCKNMTASMSCPMGTWSKNKNGTYMPGRELRTFKLETGNQLDSDLIYNYFRLDDDDYRSPEYSHLACYWVSLK